MDKETELDNTFVDLNGLYEMRIGGINVPTVVKSDLISNEWNKLTALGVKKLIYGIEGYLAFYIETTSDEDREKKTEAIAEIVMPYKIMDANAYTDVFRFGKKMKSEGPGFKEYC
jgi:hypothetical protein